MQASTNKNVRDDGRPFAATMSAPSANGSAKIVCEKRISRKKRAIGPPPSRLINNLQKAFTEGNEENEVFLDTDSTAKLGYGCSLLFDSLRAESCEKWRFSEAGHDS